MNRDKITLERLVSQSLPFIWGFFFLSDANSNPCSSAMKSLVLFVVTTRLPIKKTLSCKLHINTLFKSIYFRLLIYRLCAKRYDIGFRCVGFELPEYSPHVTRTLQGVKYPETVSDFLSRFVLSSKLASMCNFGVYILILFQTITDDDIEETPLWHEYYGNIPPYKYLQHGLLYFFINHLRNLTLIY